MKKIDFKVNGSPVTLHVGDDDRRVLLDVLREDLGLTGVKQSCDRKGQCGACTVLVNNKAVRSCLTKIADLEQAEIVTIEGLGTPDKPHPIQEAFVLSGAVQCGFCTPGMVLATKVLLDKNPHPDDDAIKEALRRNLCRCTGYKKIIKAVNLAADVLNGQTTIEQHRPDLSAGMIGVSHPRPNALALACGTAKFAADIQKDGVLELAVARSPQAHAIIKKIDYSAAAQMPGVVGIMVASDIKGSNRLQDDQPLLCDKKVHVMGDAIALVAAETRDQARAAAAAVLVEYEPLPVIETTDQALADDAVRVHENSPNLCYVHPQIKGDAASALSQSDEIVEAEFSTQLIHQAPLEPEASLAYFETTEEEEEPKLVVVGRSINIHHHLMVLQGAVGWENMRYEQSFIGGQFGIKLDITAEALAAAAALHFKRPVRYVCTLTESMWITTKRHPFKMKVRLGANRDGRLTGYKIDFTLDNGAYMSVGKAIVNRCLFMLSGSYNIPAVEAHGQLVYTNGAWGGAARGAGPPQVNYALESAMELMAQRLGMDSLEFRLLNSLQPGESISTGQVIEEWPYPGCLEALRPHYHRARDEAAASKNSRYRRGVGIAGGSFGIGRGGADRSNVAVELMPDGGLTVYGSISDPGEGNDAMLTQIAAHLMNIPPSKVHLVTRNTDQTPDASTASGSRVTYMSGGAMVKAIEDLKQAMTEVGATGYDDLVAAGKPTRYLGVRIQDATLLDPKTGLGAPFESRVHGVQLAEVEVDTETGKVRVVKITAAVDPGTVINPTIVEGQIEGGLDMGAGMALREEYIHGTTTDWISLKFPTMKTAFESEIILLETPRKKGTLGAVGVGEFVLLPTAAAIMSAIQDATGGTRICNLPATPQRVLDALKP
ncbi:molybdopterin-dependent oxidoreductase [Desulfomonile tiedjei]|uniref:Aerobic-type carbon monoxide dehydrogenase, large subunit CoxL/CutL-like protein n=1 Tax=Desulfomonile tiedjei (strain ATCC 49306 / DSM 6799 / DCB-1) TaxID=706587 RepID=I4C1K5_DESTA|nr:molybdopterin cofactor-binding domain-containing protein [Desulfomonile tiedjei]AFM23446.1 aerobic-type carbon monoxide dehydrogenase, large subunit CoxL/CutL-like protein [Desulfomonile tiedjei DSM 6799]